MTDSKETELTPLQQAEAKRAARKAKAAEAEDTQKAIDIEAIDALEEQLGDASTKAIHVGFTPGMVTAVLVRCPTRPEVKRYRDRIKPDKKGRPGDGAAANEELGAACRVYPADDDAFEALCEARPGLLAQCGSVAAALATGAEEAEGKD